jgi:hypothetical protein
MLSKRTTNRAVYFLSDLWEWTLDYEEAVERAVFRHFRGNERGRGSAQVPPRRMPTLLIYSDA